MIELGTISRGMSLLRHHTLSYKDKNFKALYTMLSLPLEKHANACDYAYTPT